jgi:hypothetical protein
LIRDETRELLKVNRNVIEKLIVAQLIKKFAVVDGNRRFITVLTRKCQRFLVWTLTVFVHFNITLSFSVGLQRRFFPSALPVQNYTRIYLFLHAYYITRSLCPSRVNHPNDTKYEPRPSEIFFSF